MKINKERKNERPKKRMKRNKSFRFQYQKMPLIERKMKPFEKKTYFCSQIKLKNKRFAIVDC